MSDPTERDLWREVEKLRDGGSDDIRVSSTVLEITEDDFDDDGTLAVSSKPTVGDGCEIVERVETESDVVDAYEIQSTERET